MTRPASLLVALASVGLLAAGLFWPLRLAYERGHAYAPGSTLRSDGEGARALYLLLEQTGARPQRVTRPAPDAARGMLLSIAPEARPAAVQNELLEWVRAGNVLLLAVGDVSEERRRREAQRAAERERPRPSPTPDAKRGTARRRQGLVPQSLEEALGLRLGPPVDDGVAVSAPADSPLRALLEGDGAERASRAFAAWPRDARVLLGASSAPVLVDLELGAGRVLALSDPAWLTNSGLPQGARLRLLRHLLAQAPGPLFFDEYRHGLVEEPGLAYVLGRYGLLPSAFALLLFLGLLAWASTPAEAPPVPPAEAAAEVRDSLIETRAGLYARSLRPADALALLERDLRSGVSSQLRGVAEPGGAGSVAGRLSWKDARRLVRETRPQAGPRLQQLLGELEHARRQPPEGLRPLLPLARRVARFLQEVR